jgi:hypothetical protein
MSSASHALDLAKTLATEGLENLFNDAKAQPHVLSKLDK